MHTENKQPIKPTFKVGDWVNIVGDDAIIFDTVQYNEEELPHGKNYEPWQPIEGEVVCFQDTNSTATCLAGAYLRWCTDAEAHVCIDNSEWDNVYPLEFVQTLKG